MNHLGLFEGIGGFSLAARWMGWHTVAWCEWNEFGQKVLKHHFPEAIGHGDITKTDFTPYANTIDILTGGFPCQPYSSAGKRKGKEDERHLWPEMLRAIGEIQPGWVVGENVLGLVNWSWGLVFDEVQTDLEAAGYEVWPYVLPSCAINTPHRRERVWFVAHLQNIHGSKGSKKKTIRICRDEFRGSFARSWHEVATRTCSLDDGISRGLDTTAFSEKRWEEDSLRAYGNAIVPQVAFEIFKAIEQYDNLTAPPIN